MKITFGKKLAIAAALAGSAFVTAAPAQARDYYRHRGGGDDAAIAIGAGVVGLALGAALASNSNRDRYYYDNDYYYDDDYYYRERPRVYYYRSYPQYYNYNYYRSYPRYYRHDRGRHHGWNRGYYGGRGYYRGW